MCVCVSALCACVNYVKVSLHTGDLLQWASALSVFDQSHAWLWLPSSAPLAHWTPSLGGTPSQLPGTSTTNTLSLTVSLPSSQPHYASFSFSSFSNSLPLHVRSFTIAVCRNAHCHSYLFTLALLLCLTRAFLFSRSPSDTSFKCSVSCKHASILTCTLKAWITLTATPPPQYSMLM